MYLTCEREEEEDNKIIVTLHVDNQIENLNIDFFSL